MYFILQVLTAWKNRPMNKLSIITGNKLHERVYKLPKLAFVYVVTAGCRQSNKKLPYAKAKLV